jgi:nucleotide-binding universal stress UspA family protein
VLLLRPHDGDQLPSNPDWFKLHHVLVPIDLSEESERILESVKDLASLLDSHLTLVHVIEPIIGVYGGMPSYPAPMSQELIESSRVRAQAHLDQLADRLRASGYRVATKVYFAMGVAGTLLRLLDEDKFDMIALTTHGAGGFRRLLLGSVADKVVRGSSRPVLILRPSAGQG